MEVHLPIKPKAPGEQGKITVSQSQALSSSVDQWECLLFQVNIRLMTQIMSKRQSVDITILPEGSMVHRHTSVMLDLKSRANEYEYMNIIVDEVRIFVELLTENGAGFKMVHNTFNGAGFLLL